MSSDNIYNEPIATEDTTQTPVIDPPMLTGKRLSEFRAANKKPTPPFNHKASRARNKAERQRKRIARTR